MAIQYLQNISLNGNEMQNFVVQPLASAPGSPAVGRKYFNTAEGRESVYRSSALGWGLAAYMSDIDSLTSTTSGINTRLKTLESYFSTTEDSDSKINKWNEIVSFLDATEGTTLAGILEAYTLKTAHNELVTKVTKAQNDIAANTTSISTLQGYFSSGIAKKATADANGNVIASYYTPIATHNTLASKVETLEGFWYLEDGILKTRYHILSMGFTAGETASASSEGGGTGLIDSAAIIDALGYTPADNADLVSLTNRVASLESGSALSVLTMGDGNVITSISKNGNAITAVKGIVALTQHQSIYELTIKNSAGTSVLAYTPNSEAKELTLTKAMVGLGNVENTALSSWAGTNKITTLGTITTGVWNGSKIANAYLVNSSVTIAGNALTLGGSLSVDTLKGSLGLGSLAFKNSLTASDVGATKKFATSISAGSATEYTITHSLGTRDVVVMVYDPNTYEQVMVDVVMTTTTAVKIGFASAPAKSYRVVVVG